MNIALFGGAFNPIHLGHLKIADIAFHKKQINKLFFIPSNLSVHKSNEGLASNFDRLQMLNLALEGTPFEISDIELTRGGSSYTIDTVLDFKKKYIDLNKIYFICGQDILDILPSFKNYELLKELVHFLVFFRDKKNIKIDNLNIDYFDIQSIPISSSIIRNSLKNGDKCNSFLNEKVLKYIKEKKLYI